MSRKRRRQLSVQTVQTLPQTQNLINQQQDTIQRLSDARRQFAARASKALRSAEVAKLRTTLIQAYNDEVYHEHVRTNPSRPVRRQSLPQTPNQRRVPNLSEVRRSKLPQTVRHSLQDGIRALACSERRTRKEVIFAVRRAGKAGSRNKKAKWTEKSYLRCK